MTIEDQIRDEKLQYDINIEAAKISTLSSGKIDKYEYLSGEEILLSNQQQIIEQAKFTYSPFIDAVADLKPKEIKPRETKPNERGDYFLNGPAEIKNSANIDFDYLKYTFKDRNNAPIDFGFKCKLHIFKSIHNGDITLKMQKKIKYNLNQT